MGSLFGGVLFDVFNSQVLLFFVLSGAAVATTVVPWCESLMILSFMIAVHGVAVGVLDTGKFCVHEDKHVSLFISAEFSSTQFSIISMIIHSYQSIQQAGSSK